MIRIKIANQQERIPIDWAKFREIGQAVLSGEGIKAARVTLAFVDNPTIHRLNKQFLDHDEPTDVLSFPMSQPGAKELEGDIVIGVEVAEAQATDRGHEMITEMALYAIHGLLHLCGYDDHNDVGRRVMRQRERHYLQLLGFPDVTDTE
jgi:probable rRNA maturation factor